MIDFIDDSLFDELDALLDQLTLGAPLQAVTPRGLDYLEIAFKRTESLLSSKDQERNRRRFELRLRLALHYSPSAAIKYDRKNPIPRWELINDFLINNYNKEPQYAESLGRGIASLLDSWDRDRQSVTTHKRFLIKRDGNYCANCHLKFGEDSRFLFSKNLLKPYFEAPEELQSIEVDHIESVSTLGDNALGNLQLLCRLCNRGKGDGLGVSIRSEASYAGIEISKIPILHRARMLYYVIEKHNKKCSKCKSNEKELTIQLVTNDASYIQTNIKPICWECQNKL